MNPVAISHIIYDAAASYPAKLRRLTPPPRTLWLRGTLENFNAISKAYRKIAIVGSRAALTADSAKASLLAAHVASLGGVVVSGGALGIDAAAHRGALSCGGATCVVLGCGIDITYPDRHAALFDAIAVRGAVLSQFAPGVTPKRGTFVRRNATIAALVDAVVIVGASLRSGALHTVAAAHELGVPVMAMPGAPGCDRLIATGKAISIQDGDELDVVCDGNYVLHTMPTQAETPMEVNEGAVLAAFQDATPRDEAWIIAAAGLAEEVVARALVALELQQLIEMVAPSKYRRVHKQVIRAVPRPAGQQVRRCHGD
ncbi:MAG: DNA-processing protein DprA [Myxococcales bacterium]|nr:DNA-processing protein DprA [Myxococcales bacterium]